MVRSINILYLVCELERILVEYDDIFGREILSAFSSIRISKNEAEGYGKGQIF